MPASPDGDARARGLVSLILLALLAASLLRDIHEPFWGLHDFNTADHAQFARAMRRLPPSFHKFLPTYAVGPRQPDEEHHYAHHPPLITWLVAASQTAFGDAEWTARLPPILCSLAGMILLMRLVREFHGDATAVLVGAIYAVLPIGAYFGRMANHEAPTLFFSLLAMWGWAGVAYRNRLDAAPVTAPRESASPPIAATAARRAALFVGLAGAIYSGWPGVLMALGTAVDALRLRRRAAITSATLALVLLVPAASLGLLLIHLIEGGVGGRWDLLPALLSARWRGEGAEPISAGQIAGTLWSHTIQNFTWPGLALIAAFFVGRFFGGLTSRGVSVPPGHAQAPTPAPIWILAFSGAAYLCLVHQARVHHYWWFQCWPAAAYFAARGLFVAGDAAARLFRRATASRAVQTLGLGATIVCGLLNTDVYFHHVDYPPNEVYFWNDLSRAIGPHTPVILRQDIRKRQRYGSYEHWWWAAPATAYYMDRPYVTAQSIDDIRRHAAAHRWFVSPQAILDREPALRDALDAICPHRVMGRYVVYDVRAPAE